RPDRLIMQQLSAPGPYASCTGRPAHSAGARSFATIHDGGCMRRRLTSRPGIAPACLAALVVLVLLAAKHAASFAQDRPDPRAPDNGGITLPDGFCATVVVDSVGPARHLVVNPNGDIFVAVRNTRG